jgi:EmrB/QacA subfamily drug resistance transporter
MVMTPYGSDSTTQGSASPWPAFGCVAVGVFMATLDSSIVHVTLPAILEDLGTTLAVVEWVANIYLLVITGLLLTFGRLADILGHKQVYLCGLATFTAGSALCAAAQGAGWLIGARAIQGGGGAMIMACTPAIVTAVFPREQRGRGLGLVGTTVAIGLTSGPPLGGLLLGSAGWRAIFLINLPIGLLALLLATRRLPALRFQKGRERFDLLGAGLFTATCAGVLLAVNRGREWGLGSPATLGLLLGACACLAGFCLWERRTPSPLVDLALFRSREFSAAVAAAVLSYLSGFVAVLLFPFYLAQVRGLGPMPMGLLLTVPPLMMSLIAPVAGALSDRMGYGQLTAWGLAVRSLAFVLFLFLGPSTPYGWVVLALALMGAGGALFNPPNTSSIMGSVAADRLGTAGGVAAVARNLGMALGIATGGAFFSGAFRAGGGASLAAYAPSHAAAFVQGWRAAMGAALTACLLAMLVSSLRSRPAARSVREP